jgi:hypothetical protein
MIVLTASFFILSGLSFAAEFSADIVIQPKEEEAIKGKIYVKGDKVRNEITEDDETQIMIMRPDKKVTWMIMPEDKMYMEMPFQEDDLIFEAWTKEKEKNAKFLKDEKIGGLATKKYEIDDEGDKIYYWISTKHSFPVKMEDEETIVEYKNIKDGSVADSLFELPSGYEKMASPIIQGGGSPGGSVPGGSNPEGSKPGSSTAPAK